MLQVVRARADIDVEVKDARHGVEPCGELLVVKCFADAHAAALVVADIVSDGGLEPVGAVPGEIRICNEVRDLDIDLYRCRAVEVDVFCAVFFFTFPKKMV